MISFKTVRAQIKEALARHDTPQRTAFAFSLGVFIAFTPTYGLHFASAIFLAWAFRLNCPALVAGTLINNPWTVVPILTATMWTGFRLSGMPEVPDFSWKDFSVHTLYEWGLPFLLPFTLGALTLSVFGAFLAYPLGLFLVSRYSIPHTNPTD